MSFSTDFEEVIIKKSRWEAAFFKFVCSFICKCRNINQAIQKRRKWELNLTQKMKNLKIGTRILLCFIVCSILFTVVGLVGVAQMQKLNKSYSSAMTDYGFTQGDLGRLGMDFQGLRTLVLYTIVEHDPEARETRKLDLEEKSEQIEADLKVVEESTHDENTKNIIKDLKKKIEEYNTVYAEAIKISEQSSEEGVAFFSAEAAPRASVIQGTIEKCFANKSEQGHNVSMELLHSANTSKWFMLTFIFITFALSMVAGIAITKGIIHPLKELTSAAETIAEGNFNVNFDYSGNDEIDTLTKAMRTMIDSIMKYMGRTIDILEHIAKRDISVNFDDQFPADYVRVQDSLCTLLNSLNGILYDVSDISDTVALGSSQVSEGAAALADSSQEQAASVSHLSDSIEQVSERINSNSNDAILANDNAKEVKVSISKNATQMQELMTAMKGINAKAEEIEKITKTIEDIAFQTNILALNAAVEAARAGAAGRGFSVVADEVRNLANKSQEASQNTEVLIAETIQAISDGMNIMDKTTKGFDEAANGVEEMAKKIEQIASASEAQAKEISEIVRGVDQISGAIQTNSATAEESAAVSRSLSEQASQLKETVSKFTLRSKNI